MEFFSMINKLLKRSAECRRRNLHVRTYTVLPLNEECGILEWVENTHPLRGILRSIYDAKNLTVRRQEV
jgi:serine/threonine-protein kinase ATR